MSRRHVARRYPPQCLGDVARVCDAAAAWSRERTDVVGFAARLVELAPNGRPAVELTVQLRVGDARPHFVELVDARTEHGEAPGRFVRRVLTAGCQDAKRRSRAVARAAAAAGKGV